MFTKPLNCTLNLILAKLYTEENKIATSYLEKETILLG